MALAAAYAGALPAAAAVAAEFVALLSVFPRRWYAPCLKRPALTTVFQRAFLEVSSKKSLLLNAMADHQHVRLLPAVCRCLL
jgi:hypothetical protein